MSDVQARVQSLLNDLVERDIERGLQVAAYHRGQLVVDAWAGLANVQTGQPVDGDTLFCVFSCTKAVTATAIHLLVERGLLAYDVPIAHYWPEFGRNGKAGITLRQVLSHTAGIPQVPDGMGPAESCDWEKVCRAISNLEPLWEPGTRTGYHALTMGWILGEVARRVDGRPFGQIVRDEIARPLGIDDLYLGIPGGVEDRVAFLETLPPTGAEEEPPPDALFWRVFPPSYDPWGDWANRSDVRRACVPAANGMMSARAHARFYAALLLDTPGPRLLSPERVRLATTLQTEEDDLVFGPGWRKSLGYMLGGGDFSTMGMRSTSFGHPGGGGSFGFADPEYDFAFALTKTRMVEAAPGEGASYLIARETRHALGIPN